MNRWVSFLILMFFVFSLPACTPDPLQPLPVGPTNGWEVLRPLPVGYNLYDIWGESSANVWAVGMYGTIVNWDGETVRQVDSPTKETLSGLDGWGPDDIYAVGFGDLIHYDGRTWNRLEHYEDRDIDDVLCSPDGRLYLAGGVGLWYRDEFGTHSIDGLPNGYAKVMWLGPDGLLRIGIEDQLWLVENDTAALEQEFTDGEILFGDGKFLALEYPTGFCSFYTYSSRGNWEGSGQFIHGARAILDKGEVVYANNGGIQHSGGYGWHNTEGRWIYKLAHCGESEILACGHAGTLLHGVISSFDVEYQEGFDEIGYRSIKSMAGTGPDNIWAGEYWGRVLHFDGETWQIEFSGLSGDHNVTRLQVDDEGWVIAAGDNKVALRSTEGYWGTLPELPAIVWHVNAASPDSIMAATSHYFYMWNGAEWQSAGSANGSVFGLSRTPSGKLYSLVSSLSSILKIWDGNAFVTEQELPLCVGRLLCASEETETLWIAGADAGNYHNTIVYEYSGGELRKVSTDGELPSGPVAMSENEAGDLFLLSGDQVWRYHNESWSHQKGLPANESYNLLWSHPDCGVYVQGHPTFFKDYSQE